MTRLYTRSGDQGRTGLADGTRVAKTSARVAALGAVDECNAQLGVLAAHLPASHPLRALVQLVQHQLFDLGAMLAGADGEWLADTDITGLETHIDRLDGALPPLKQFIIPGGGLAAAQAQVARSLCRRAELSVFALAEQEHLREVAPKYLNRLSDLLFVVARTLAQEGDGDQVWQPRGARGD